jgi:hypothetical protein
LQKESIANIDTSSKNIDSEPVIIFLLSNNFGVSRPFIPSF